VKLALLALAATLTFAATQAAEGGVRTTAPPETVTIKIIISDTKIQVAPRSAPRGDIGRFILVNVGKKAHTFALGHTKRGTGSQTGFVKSVKPGEQVILILFLDYRGKLPYFGTLPADRSKPGMKGTFRIV
jgi:hypothetical protein